jgi:hypothetical protein
VQAERPRRWYLQVAELRRIAGVPQATDRSPHKSWLPAKQSICTIGFALLQQSQIQRRRATQEQRLNTPTATWLNPNEHSIRVYTCFELGITTRQTEGNYLEWPPNTPGYLLRQRHVIGGRYRGVCPTRLFRRNSCAACQPRQHENTEEHEENALCFHWVNCSESASPRHPRSISS